MILITEHEVKDPEGQVILDAIATRYGYPETIQDEEGIDISNPQTKQEFYQNWIMKTTLTVVGEHLVATAADVAAKLKQAEVDGTVKPELEVVKKP